VACGTGRARASGARSAGAALGEGAVAEAGGRPTVPSGPGHGAGTVNGEPGVIVVAGPSPVAQKGPKVPASTFGERASLLAGLRVDRSDADHPVGARRPVGRSVGGRRSREAPRPDPHRWHEDRAELAPQQSTVGRDRLHRDKGVQV